MLRAVVDPKTPYRSANVPIDYMATNWDEVSVDQTAELASQGIIVIGG